MKGKTSSKGNSTLKTNLGLPVVFILCTFFFLAGLYCSTLVVQNEDDAGGKMGPILLESTEREYELLISGKTGDDSINSIPFQVLSWYPRAVYFSNFATPEQCKSIISMAAPSLKPSTLALRKDETKESTKDVRTSTGTFISASEDNTGILDVIEEKIARVTMLPRTYGEAFNILRYKIGQKYNSHYDAFHPSEYGPQKSQRVASFLLYLSDVEGGETVFPYENGSNMDGNYDFEECLGLKVKPRSGDGLLFYSLLPNGTIDPTSLHGSCPVIKGEKWVATKWIRDQERYV